MITKIINKILSKLGINIIQLGEFDCIRDKAREINLHNTIQLPNIKKVSLSVIFVHMCNFQA